MGTEEKAVVDAIFQEYLKTMDERNASMEKKYKALLKFTYGTLAAMGVAILFYFITFGEVKANASSAQEGVIRMERQMQEKADKAELTTLKEDVQSIKTAVGRIEGMLNEHLRNDR
jgi:hypothetical protein